MTARNAYAALSEYKAYVVARGQTSSTDATDDEVINNLLEQASRYIDDETGRAFYPFIQARVYSAPNSLELCVYEDLLEVITLTNGDDVLIAASNYVLETANNTPYWKLRLRSTSTTYWLPDSANGEEQVIELRGWYGYRESYSQRAWKVAGTLGAAITDTTTLAFTMSAGHTLTAGHIIKIDSEIYNVNTVVTNTITPLARGDNGSTAVTHLNGATVYVWQPEPSAKQAALEVANSAYMRRFGRNTGESATVTAAGVVLTPQDIPATAKMFISRYKRMV